MVKVLPPVSMIPDAMERSRQRPVARRSTWRAITQLSAGENMNDGIDFVRDLLTMGAGRITNYFSHQFLVTAEMSAKAAGEAEAKITRYDPLRPDPAHYAHVTTAVVLSVTALEAWINEFYWDCGNASPDHVKGISDAHRTRLGKLWSCDNLGLEKRSILEKYFVGLELGLEKPTQQLRGGVEYADAKALIELRNAFVHFKPEAVEFDARTVREKQDLPRLERVLERKFDENPQASGMPFFPHRCVSAGCATWSVRSATRFTAVSPDLKAWVRQTVASPLAEGRAN